jgi:hypothetical protein
VLAQAQTEGFHIQLVLEPVQDLITDRPVVA